MKKILSLFSFVIACIFFIACTPTEPTNTEGKDYEKLFNGNWNTPGLHKANGEEHITPTIIHEGILINVLDFGVVIGDENNTTNYSRIKEAIESAQAGDTVFFPSGDYYLQHFWSGAYFAHIVVNREITLMGEADGSSRLISKFEPRHNEQRQTTTILVTGYNVIIKNLAISAITDDSELPDPESSTLQSGVYTAPKYGITVATLEFTPFWERQARNVVIDNVLVEKFQRIGIRIVNARDVVVQNSTLQKGVNLGAGGAGYGVVIQGDSHGNDRTDTTADPVHNVVKNNKFLGPWLRHGTLIQYYAHNNLITNNEYQDVLLDAIDMHGENEYSNEISYNLIKNTRAGAAVGIGNSGATHSKAGRNNFVHNNIIDGGLRGVDIILGSERQIVVNNIIKNLTLPRSRGIYLSNASGSYIMNNTLENINGDEGHGYGVRLDYAYIMDNPMHGRPHDIRISGNTFDSVKEGIFAETYGDNFIVENNIFKGSFNSEFTNTKSTYIIPEKSNLMDPVAGEFIIPTDMNFITTEGRDLVSSQNNLKLKSSILEPLFNRMIYAKFDTTVVPEHEKVYLAFAAKAQIGAPTINFWVAPNYTNWQENEITWNNSLFHADTIAGIQRSEGDNLINLNEFTFPIVDYNFHTYYVDITEVYRSIGTTAFTIIISDDAVGEVYIEVYNQKIAQNDLKFRLIFA